MTYDKVEQGDPKTTKTLTLTTDGDEELKMTCLIGHHGRRKQLICSRLCAVDRCGRFPRVFVSPLSILIHIRGVIAWIAVIILLMGASTALIVRAVVSGSRICLD